MPGLPNVVRTREVAISTGLTGRIYTPSNATASLPVLVYAHGGGWAVGSVETHDPFCRLLSEARRRHRAFARVPPGTGTPVPGLDDGLAASCRIGEDLESYPGQCPA
jgi:alpha/beta hydrolase fold